MNTASILTRLARTLTGGALVGGVLGASLAAADPCGMVPPVYLPNVDQQPTIERTGVQATYVFFRDGVETMVLHPGFKGNSAEFGMLIPFPTPPEVRKVPDNTFAQIAAAVDPPVLTVDTSQVMLDSVSLSGMGRRSRVSKSKDDMEEDTSGLRFDEVRVLRQEAMGMYELAVLQAGSTRALDRWMTEHSFRYPEGMDAVIGDYVSASWCFVAVKARVGQKAGTDPRPGMRTIEHDLPAGASFDGHVQAMGFRFEVDEPVVPMRMSTFNGDDTHNLLYFLAEEPLRMEGVPVQVVKRQVKGTRLHRNMTEPLPLLVVGGQRELGPNTLAAIAPLRDPGPYNGVARDLFASDLLSVRTGELSLPFEARGKELLNISEALGLRGAAVDTLHRDVVSEDLDRATQRAFDDVKEMTLTVFDGDLPRGWIRDHNLSFARWQMGMADNQQAHYDARAAAPGPRPMPTVHRTWGSVD